MNGGMPWTCATLPFPGAHSLAPRPGSLVRLTFQIGPRGRTCTCNLSVLSGTSLLIGLHAVGAHGRIRTDTVRVLSAPSLHWTTWAKWCRVRDFHPQPLRSERSVSCSWTNAAKWRSRQESHLQPGGSEAARSDNLSYGSKA